MCRSPFFIGEPKVSVVIMLFNFQAADLCAV